MTKRTYEMRVLDLFHDHDIIKLDIQILVHTLESSSDGNVILQLDGHLLRDERLEEAMIVNVLPSIS